MEQTAFQQCSGAASSVHVRRQTTEAGHSLTVPGSGCGVTRPRPSLVYHAGAAGDIVQAGVSPSSHSAALGSRRRLFLFLVRGRHCIWLAVAVSLSRAVAVAVGVVVVVVVGSWSWSCQAPTSSRPPQATALARVRPSAC